MSDENLDLLKEKYSSTFKEYRKVKRLKLIYKISIFSLIFAYVVFIITYFSLPQFKLSGISFSGLVNLTKEDVITLMGERPNKSLLFFNSNDKAKVLIDNSNNIILENNLIVSTDSFSGYVHITEDYPVVFINDNNNKKLYFSSGRNINEYENSINLTSLSDASKKRILDEFKKYENEEDDYHLPTLHLSSTISTIDNNVYKQALYYLQGVSFKNLTKYISDINYPTNSFDNTIFSNGVMELYIDSSINKRNICISNIRSNKLYALLEDDTFLHVLSNINNYIDKQSNSIIKNNITFSDGTVKENVYNFRFRFIDKQDSFTIEAINDSEVNNE